MRSPQLTIDVRLAPGDRRRMLEADALHGLSARPKVLSPVWFYDERGSRLFEDITRLPEYYLTRAERRLLDEHAGDIARRADADTLIELGSGYSEKTRILIDAMTAAGNLERYVPLDVSEPALRDAALGLTEDYPQLRVHGIVGDLHRHIGALPPSGRRLVAFLGSTIGNLGPPERHRFFSELDNHMTHDDRLLMGVDLLKDRDRLTAAYDDASGVTAAFNLNALHVLNRELGADFRPDGFVHVAVWNPDEGRMEMRLRATAAQRVYVSSLDLQVDIEEGEEIRTEISTKFTMDQICTELGESGFVVENTWMSAPDEFALILAKLRRRRE